MPPRRTTTPAPAGPDAAHDAGPFKVKATRLGFLEQRRRPGDVFVINPEQFSAVWMERVDDATPLLAQSAQEAARQAHREALSTPRLKSNGADLVDDDEPDDQAPTGDKTVI
jgi:hypothetical protein